MKKLRGNKRRLRQIENWRINNLRLDIGYLQQSNKDYVKLRVFPWNPIAMSLHNFPKPKGKIRKKIVESFFDIYESWNIKLKELGIPYYLKIWLFEPDIYNSQIVCAINEKIEYYENIFYKPALQKSIETSITAEITNRINKYNWEFCIEEYPVFESEYLRENFSSEKEYLEELQSLQRLFKKSYREIDQDINGITEKIYLIKGSEVWLGENKS